MRAAVCAPGLGVRVEEVPLPALEPGDVLVRVGAACVCATDRKIARGEHPRVPRGVVRVLGHEVAGEVVEVRGPEDELQVGDRVGLVPNVGCGRCAVCAQGLDALCPRAEAFGITLDGGFAEYVRVPARAVRRGHVIPLPEGIPFEEAALAEPLACVLQAHELVRTGPGDRVLVLGGGAMGLLNAVVGRRCGAAEVVVADPHPDRRALGRELGADRTLHPEELDASEDAFDVVVATAASPSAQDQAVRCAAVRGRVHLFAGLPSPGVVSVDTNRIHYRQLLVTGSTGQTVEHYRRALRMLPRLRPQLGRIVTHRVGLEGLEAVLHGMEQRQVLKAAVLPWETS